MELRHMKYFITLAEELHFGRAAERLNMAQPPLSLQIKQLEEEIGVPLLYRTKRNVTLTDAGEIFLKRAVHILSQVDKACEEARQVYKGQIGQLIIGFAGGTAYDLLRFQKAFREIYPLVDFILRRLGTADQVTALHEGKIDIGLLFPPIESNQLDVLSIRHQSIVVVLPSNHPLAASTTPIDVKEFEKESFIMTPRKAGPSYHDKLMNICYKSGFLPRITLEAHELETIVSYVAAGVGISIVPYLFQDHRVEGIVYKELKDVNSTLEMSMAWRKEEYSHTVHAFIEIAKKCISAEGVTNGFRKDFLVDSKR